MPSSHRKTPQDIALPHAAWGGPSWLKSARAAEGNGNGRNKSGEIKQGEASRDETLERPCKRPKLRRRRGGGGAWRAFIHYQVVERRVKPDFRKLGGDFASLCPEDRAWYKQLGEIGP